MEYSYLKKAEYIGDYKIKCTFENGECGTLDLKSYLAYGGVFNKLQNESYAKNIKLDSGVITWGNGELDIAPESVYAKVITHKLQPI